jgi:4-methyl-5(b-hydroxyethyl)-thiazole monophosphate biosynthesis
VVLASNGLLFGKKATCYPAQAFVDALGELYTGVDVQVSDNLITANGPKSAMKFALAICEYLGAVAKF